MARTVADREAAHAAGAATKGCPARFAGSQRGMKRKIGPLYHCG